MALPPYHPPWMKKQILSSNPSLPSESMRRLIKIGIISLGWLFAGIAFAQEDFEGKDPASNAALYYLQAFWQYPALTREFPDDKERLVMERKFRNGEFDEDTTRYLEVVEPHLRWMHEGASRTWCVWGDTLDYLEENSAYSLNLARCQSLGRLAMACYAYRVSQGRFAAAQEDFRATWQLGNHCPGNVKTIIGLLVKSAIHQGAIDRAAKCLPQLDQGALRNLVTFWRTEREPFRWEASDYLEAEAAGTIGAVVNRAQAASTPAAMAALREWMQPVGFNMEGELFKSADTSGQMLAALEILEQYIQQAAKVLAFQDHQQFKAALERFRRKLDDQPVASSSWVAATTLEKYYQRFKAYEIEVAMFDAALDILLQGPQAALAKVKDPSNGQPFNYHEVPDGFVLESAFDLRTNKLVRLAVGYERSSTVKQ